MAGAAGVDLVGRGDIRLAAEAEIIEHANGPNREEGVEAGDGHEALPERVDEGFLDAGREAA